MHQGRAREDSFQGRQVDRRRKDEARDRDHRIGLFQVTVPATTTSVTVPPEFVASLASGVQPYEVLAIEARANQTLIEDTFMVP